MFVVHMYHRMIYIWTYLRHLGRIDVREMSKIIEDVIERPKNLRHLFLTQENITVFPTRNSHSHPTAAAFRTAVNQYMNGLVVAAGMVPYNISMSPTDSGSGTRYFYGLKDLATPFQDDDISAEHVLIMTDVDYYTDMNKWLAYGRPILVYTFSPTKVVGRTKDFAYRFRGNRVEYNVAGGGLYSHELWDYKGDVVSVREQHDCLRGGGRLIVYNIEQRQIEQDPEHRFVVFTPMAFVPYPYAMLLPTQEKLKRKVIQQGGFSLMYEPISDQLSLAKSGTWQSVEMSGRAYEAIKSRMACKTSPPVVSDIERLLRTTGSQTAGTDAPLLFDLMGLELKTNVVKTTDVPTNFTPIGPLATEDSKPTGKATTSPLVSEPALFAAKGVNSDVSTIKGRVTDVKNTKIPPRVYKDYANEFASLIVKLPGVGNPLTVEDVRKRQNNPQQKARYNMVAATMSTTLLNRLECFVKAEPYANVTDPRNITTMSPELTTNLSCFTLSFKENVLKQFKWYGPGKTPKQMVKRLRDLALGDKFDWLCTDYSRLDGTVSEWLQRYVVQATYLRWVADDYKAELKRLLDQVFIKSGRTAHGEKFDAGWGTRSGSPQTTDGNTMICAFIDYCAYRLQGFTPKQAFEKLALVYGDDGCRKAEPGLPETLEGVARVIGLKLKTELVSIDDPVPFLGRYFVNPATTNDSFQDPKRTLSKLHLTANKSLTPAQAATNKATGYLVTDKLTPLISNWANSVVRITGLKPKAMSAEETYKCSNAWPQSNASAIREAVAKVLNISEAEMMELARRLDDVKELDQFPVVLDTTREVKITADVEGEIVVPTPHIQNIQDELQPDTAQGLPRPVGPQGNSRNAPAASRPSRETARVRGKGKASRPLPRGSKPAGSQRSVRPSNARPDRTEDRGSARH
jgi:hypothetical protein